MSENGLRNVLQGSPISWSALIGVGLAVITGMMGYGRLEQRVQHLEDQLSSMQPMAVVSKLAVIEADGKRAAGDIGQIQKDLSDIRRMILEERRGP